MKERKYSVDNLTDRQLKQVLDMYEDKILRLESRLTLLFQENPSLVTMPNEEVKFLKSKLERLKDKLASCEKEAKERGLKIG